MATDKVKLKSSQLSDRSKKIIKKQEGYKKTGQMALDRDDPRYKGSLTQKIDRDIKSSTPKKRHK